MTTIVAHSSSTKSPEYLILFKEVEENSKENIDNYYTLTLFVETIRKAFGFITQYKNEIFPILVKWNQLLLNKTKRYKKYDWIDDTEYFENKKIHFKEIVKLINIGILFKNKYKMKPFLSLPLALSILYGTLIFEPTMIDISLEDIYKTMSIKRQTKNGLKTFKKKFFIYGMSDEIRNILYCRI